MDIVKTMNLHGTYMNAQFTRQSDNIEETI